MIMQDTNQDQDINDTDTTASETYLPGMEIIKKYNIKSIDTIKSWIQEPYNVRYKHGIRKGRNRILYCDEDIAKMVAKKQIIRERRTETRIKLRKRLLSKNNTTEPQSNTDDGTNNKTSSPKVVVCTKVSFGSKEQSDLEKQKNFINKARPDVDERPKDLVLGSSILRPGLVMSGGASPRIDKQQDNRYSIKRINVGYVRTLRNLNSGSRSYLQLQTNIINTFASDVECIFEDEDYDVNIDKGGLGELFGLVSKKLVNEVIIFSKHIINPIRLNYLERIFDLYGTKITSLIDNQDVLAKVLKDDIYIHCYRISNDMCQLEKEHISREIDGFVSECNKHISTTSQGGNTNKKELVDLTTIPCERSVPSPNENESSEKNPKRPKLARDNPDIAYELDDNTTNKSIPRRFYTFAPKDRTEEYLSHRQLQPLCGVKSVSTLKDWIDRGLRFKRNEKGDHLFHVGDTIRLSLERGLYQRNIEGIKDFGLKTKNKTS